MATDLKTERCVICGQFMNCEEIDASCEFAPDSDYSIESTAWTCGPCNRRKREGED